LGDGAEERAAAKPAGLEAQIAQLIRLTEEMIHLQKVALLEPGHVLRFSAPGGQEIAMTLPQAQSDFVQRMILRHYTFYEARLLALIQANLPIGPQSVVCDLGANIGNHTLFFALVLGVAKVIAVEPQPNVHATLERNIALNQLEGRVVTHRAMLGDAAGSGRIAKFNPRNLGGTAFAVGEGEIPMVTLDSLIDAVDLDRLDLIKIDVEGMQHAVLLGGEAVIAARRPPLWIEIHANEPSAPETLAWLDRLGYRSTKIGPQDYLFRV
jgi:FkbM family methyltransferase